MRKFSYALLLVVLAGTLSSCVVAHDRYGSSVVAEPEFWGTVTYVDPTARWIDLDYAADGGRHMSRRVYYDERATRWDGVRYTELRAGDQIVVHGRNQRGRYRVDSVRRH
ncbi:MAG: hypothetical protein JWN02_1927 [Acidobacteria bacterium]|nr:hypothetical protein [Acidobacteriota bacterium]